MIKPFQLHSQKGFTIVELLVVMVVIGILATIVSVSYSGAQSKANKSSFNATAQQVKLKLGDYFTDNNKYPNVKGDTTTAGTVLKYLSDTTGSTSALVTEFTKSAYTYTAVSATNGTCDNNTTACTSYTISVPVSAWKGPASDTPLAITP